MNTTRKLTSATLGRFASAIGEEATLRLAAQFGGRQLYVASSPRPDSELVQVIGSEAAEQLGRRYGGVIYQVPLREGKRARIIQLLDAGKAVADIAEQVGCTERHVYHVQAERRAEGAGIPRRKKKRARKKKIRRVEPPRQTPQTDLFGE